MSWISFDDDKCSGGQQQNCSHRQCCRYT